MKKLLALMVIALTMFLFGCYTSDNDNNDGDTGGLVLIGGTISAERYLPLSIDNTWTYDIINSDNPSSESTSVITDTATLGGNTYYMEVKDLSNVTNLRIEDNIVYSYLDEVLLAKAQAQKAALEEKEVPLFDFNKSAGDSWTVFSESKSEDGYSSSIEMKVTYVGKKDVTVSAGTYFDCVVFETITETTLDYNTTQSSFSNTETTYFAADVGLVKQHSVVEKTNWGVSSSYTETSELKSFYLVPDDDGGHGSDTATYNIHVITRGAPKWPGLYFEATATINGVAVTKTITADLSQELGFHYILRNCANGTWTVTPHLYHAHFTPASIEVVVDGPGPYDNHYKWQGEGEGLLLRQYSVVFDCYRDEYFHINGGNEYMPLVKHARWNYSVTTTHSDGTVTKNPNVRFVIPGVRQINSKLYYHLIFNEDSNKETLVRMEDNNLYFLSRDNIYDKSQIFPSSKSPPPGEIERSYFSFGTLPGDKVIEGYEDVVDPHSGEIDDLFFEKTNLGKKTVTVEAGTFTDIVCHELVRVTYDSVVIMTFWFARGIGIVKVDMNCIPNNGSSVQRWSSVRELTSYSGLEYLPYFGNYSIPYNELPW